MVAFGLTVSIEGFVAGVTFAQGAAPVEDEVQVIGVVEDGTTLAVMVTEPPV